jgi:hypothetical protein
MTFNGTSSTNETSYSWDLDGKKATGPVVTANYSSDPVGQPVSHLVFLTVKGPGGTSEILAKSVHCP